MDGNQTILKKPEELKSSPKDTDDTKAFTFDHSYWSADKNDPTYADQERVFQDLGVDLLDHAFDGYNCCIFACNINILMHLLSTHTYSRHCRWSDRFWKVLFHGKDPKEMSCMNHSLIK